MKKLNLGSGKDIRRGWVNLDIVKSEGVNVVWNLERFPYPFKDSEFDLINCHMILEHLDDVQSVIKELWRISKKGATIFIEVPHFSSWQAWGDITHKKAFNHSSLFPFSNKPQHRGSASLINNQKEVFNIKPKIKMGKIKKSLGFERIFNLNNYARGFYERNLANIFPAESILWELRVIKNESKNKD